MYEGTSQSLKGDILQNLNCDLNSNCTLKHKKVKIQCGSLCGFPDCELLYVWKHEKCF